MSTRINARLEAEHGRKLAYLQARTGKSATEIVKASLELYFESVAGPRNSRALLEDFVGSARADEHLSSNYKTALTAALDQKLSAARKRGRRA
jgi:hypothetical protein